MKYLSLQLARFRRCGRTGKPYVANGPRAIIPHSQHASRWTSAVAFLPHRAGNSRQTLSRGRERRYRAWSESRVEGRAMDWAALREECPVTRRWAFFDHAAVAPLTARAQQAMAEWAADLAEN